jgi:peptide/nickel transport system substrate-binding protein
MNYPNGNLKLAKQYMLKARAQGVKNINAQGMYTGPAVLAAGDSGQPHVTTALVLQGQLRKIGIKLDLKLVPRSTMYSEFCTVPNSGYVVCPTVGITGGATDPYLIVPFEWSGNFITKQGNTNFSLLNVPSLNRRMAAAKFAPASTRLKIWGKIDHDIVAQAPGIPYIWDYAWQVNSKNIGGTINRPFGLWDLTRMYQK